MIKDFFSFDKAKQFLDKLKVGGKTIKEILFSGVLSSEQTTFNRMIEAFKTAKKNKLSPGDFEHTLSDIIQKRKAPILTTFRNIMLGARQEMENRFARKVDYFYSYVVLDGRSSKVCPVYVGEEWHKKWSEIPSVEKPPRTSGAFHKGVHHHQHRCRSRIIPIKTGEAKPDTRDLITQFNSMSKKEKRDILKRKSVIKAYESGELELNTTKQLIDARLISVKKLLK